MRSGVGTGPLGSAAGPGGAERVSWPPPRQPGAGRGVPQSAGQLGGGPPPLQRPQQAPQEAACLQHGALPTRVSARRGCRLGVTRARVGSAPRIRVTGLPGVGWRLSLSVTHLPPPAWVQGGDVPGVCWGAPCRSSPVRNSAKMLAPGEEEDMPGPQPEGRPSPAHSLRPAPSPQLGCRELVPLQPQLRCGGAQPLRGVPAPGVSRRGEGAG